MRPKAPDDFSSLVYFGDSLSDNGNLFRLIGQPPSPPFTLAPRRHLAFRPVGRKPACLGCLRYAA
jgi:hypothetical protein